MNSPKYNNQPVVDEINMTDIQLKEPEMNILKKK